MIDAKDILEAAHAVKSTVIEAEQTVMPVANGILSIAKAVKFVDQTVRDYQFEASQKLVTEVMSNFRNGTMNEKEQEEEFQKLFELPLERRTEVIKIWNLSYKTLLESVDEQMLIALGRLTSVYLEKMTLKRGQEVKDTDVHLATALDGFFRSACRLLMDLTFDEYCSLKFLISSINRRIMNPDYDEYEMLKVMALNEELVLVNYSRSKNENKDSFDQLEGDLACALRVFSLLKAHALASEGPAGGFGTSSGPLEMCINREIIKRLIPILG